jgi:hypothetical protein
VIIGDVLSAFERLAPKASLSVNLAIDFLDAMEY